MAKRDIELFKIQQEKEDKQSRQKRREDIFQDRRAIQGNPEANVVIKIGHERQEKEQRQFECRIEELQEVNYTIEMLNDLFQAVRESNIIRNHYGVFGLSKLLRLRIFNVQQFVNGKQVIKFAKLLEYPKLQQKSLEIMLEMAQNGHHIQLQRNGAINLCLALLQSTNEQVVQTSLKVIFTLADQNRITCHTVIRSGGLDNITDLYQSTKNQPFKIDICHTLVLILNLSYPGFYPFSIVSKALRIFYTHFEQILEIIGMRVGVHLMTKYSSGVDQVKLLLQFEHFPIVQKCYRQQYDSLFKIFQNMAQYPSGIQRLLSLDFQYAIQDWSRPRKQAINIYRQITRTLSNLLSKSRYQRPTITEITKYFKFEFPGNILRLCSVIIRSINFDQSPQCRPAEISELLIADLVLFVFECLFQDKDENFVLKLLYLIYQELTLQKQFTTKLQLDAFGKYISGNKIFVQTVQKLQSIHKSTEIREILSIIREKLLISK